MLVSSSQHDAQGVTGASKHIPSDIVRANTQISDLQALDAVHIESLVEDAVLDDFVALSRRHGTGSK